MDEISLKALAKINLGLDVLGKREDGYHEVRMIMQTIHLYDRVEIKKTKSPHIHVETNLFYLPSDENNLVYKAAKLMKTEFKIKEGVRITLQKFIPVAAGMAGGEFRCSRCAGGDEPYVQSWPQTEPADGAGLKVGGGCAVLRDARHGPWQKGSGRN